MGLGEKVNCTDSANTVSTLANLLGCDLWQSRMGWSFDLNPLIAIGYQHPFILFLLLLFAIGVPTGMLAGEVQRGTMELILSRRLQERRIFPAYDIERSSTRREELLLSGDELQRVYTMRRMLAHLMDTPGYDISSATGAVLQRMRETKTNYEFLETLTRDMM